MYFNLRYSRESSSISNYLGNHLKLREHMIQFPLNRNIKIKSHKERHKIKYRISKVAVLMMDKE